MLHAAAPRRIAVTLVTPERAPLDLFGPAVTEMIRAEFTEAGIEFLCGTSAQVPSARIVETGHGHRLRVDRILHLPGVAGPRIAGLPCDPDGFIPVGADLHVDDDPDVLAIGDGAVGAYKHGGLAALQADAVAQELAARAGASSRPSRTVPRSKRWWPRTTARAICAPSPRAAPARASSLRNACGGRRPRSPRTGSRRGSPRSIPRRPTTRRRRADRGRREGDGGRASARPCTAPSVIAAPGAPEKSAPADSHEGGRGRARGHGSHTRPGAIRN